MCLLLFCDAVLFKFCNHLAAQERAGFLAVVWLLVSVSLPSRAVGWSVVSSDFI